MRTAMRGMTGVTFALAAGATVLLAVVLGTNIGIQAASRSAIFGVRDAPVRQTAVVFGAGVEPDGSPSAMLGDRLALAVQLYRARKVGRILLSGDDRPGDRETPAMLAYVRAARVPLAAVLVDDRGFSTRETCLRARTAYGIRSATLVTQAYHLSRALFVCRSVGLDAVGVGAADWGNYTIATMVTHTAREALASTTAALRAVLMRR